MTDTKFEWPCDRRIAHGPHPTDDGVCPGLPAHPATMIGGNLPEDEWEDE